MKNFTFGILFTFLLAPVFMNAQVYLSEDFNAGWPAGWTTIDNDMNVVNANIAPLFPNAWVILTDLDSIATVNDSVAASTSWYTPAGTSDDYMVSPMINIGPQTGVFWDAKARDASFPDGYELRISTTTPDVAGFTANPVLYSIGAAVSSWNNISVNLAAAGYANQGIYLAWVNNATDDFILVIDNVVVKELAAFDLALASADSMSEYTHIPFHQNPSINLGAQISNVGSAAVTDAKVIAEVFKDGVSVHQDSSAGITLGGSMSTTATMAPYIPMGKGSYTVTYSTSIAETDSDPANDSQSSALPLVVSDSVYARDGGVANVINGLGIGAGTTGELGLNYTFSKLSDLSSISVFLANIDDVMVGQPISVKVYFFADTPSVEILQTEIVTVTQTGPHWVELPLPGGASFPLPTGTFNFAIQEGDSSVSMGYTADIFTPGAAWVSFAAIGGWAPSELLGFPVSYMIRPNVNCNLKVDLASVTDNTCPDDMNGAIDITVSGGAAPYSFAWSNGDTNEDPMGLAVGTYTGTVTDAEGCEVKAEVPVVATDSLPDGSFTSSIVGGQVGFTATSTNGTSYSWDFGDGGTSTLQDPTHTYASNGAYTVVLTITNDCGSTMVTEVVDMQTVGLEDDLARNITIAPNPNQGTFNVHFEELKLEDVTIEVFTMSGQKVYSEQLDPIASSYDHAVNLDGSLTKGIYLLEISTDKTKIRKRFNLE